MILVAAAAVLVLAVTAAGVALAIKQKGAKPMGAEAQAAVVQTGKPSAPEPIKAPGAPAQAKVVTPPVAIRLALVATGEDTRPLADLLTVSLSQTAGVTLLERAEIERVWREQSLTAAGRGSSVKLGELLGADGVL